MGQKTTKIAKRSTIEEEQRSDDFDNAGEDLSAEQLSDPQTQFFQIIVPAAESATGDDLQVYLDTTTLQLHYGPPVSSIIDPRENYSTVFIIQPVPDSERFKLFNYVVSGRGPMATQSSATTYTIKLDASQGYDYVYIKNNRGRSWRPGLPGLFSISMKKDGKTVVWCPTNTNSSRPSPATQIIQGEIGEQSMFTDVAFRILTIPKSLMIPPPIQPIDIVSSGSASQAAEVVPL